MRRILVTVTAIMLSSCAASGPIEVQTISDASRFADASMVEIRVKNFSFEPKVVRLTQGRAYRLTLVNEASGGHSFGAPRFFEAAQIAASDAEKVTDGKIEVAGNSTVTVDLVPARGTYDLDCTHFAHSALGMTGEIVVE